MGISGFQKWIDKLNLRNYIRYRQKYNYLAIDLNGILHISIKNAKTYNQFFKAVNKELNKILKVLLAKNIAFFIDGTAPMAKLKKQISRRRKRKFNGDTLDQLQITPGTDLMNQLLLNLKNNYPNIYLDDSKNPGEGEIKLIRWLLNQKPTGKIAIFGSDADLVLIATAARPLINLSIVSRDKKGFNWINIDQFWKKLPGNREDITLICMLLGNDYFPGLPGLNYKNFWQNYSKKLFRHNKLCTKNWIEYLKKIEVDNNIVNKSDGSAKEYFKALLWCLNMYSKGICSDYSFNYIGGAPTIQSCIEFLESGVKFKIPQTNISPLSEEEALLILMPKWGLPYLPLKLRSVIDDPNYFIGIQKNVRFALNLGKK